MLLFIFNYLFIINIIVTFLSTYYIFSKKNNNVVDLMKRLTLIQYRRMVNTIIEFKKLNGELPAYTNVDGIRINKDAYIDMIERVNKFLLEMGRNPGAVEIGNSHEKFKRVGKILAH